MPLGPGARLGPYEILSAIGAGGMGEVYKAKDTRLNRTVALKILRQHIRDNPELKQRFEREAQAIAALEHPHICVLHDIGHDSGIDFLVMEYVEGQALSERLEKGALPLDQALQYAIQIADALDKAHRQGITHRDLKPGNIMLTKSGVKLLDFGLAKLAPVVPVDVAGITGAVTQRTPLTGQGTILGTLQYMAPEQVEGKDADPRSDIFALGAVLYEMVTAKKAFEGNSAASVIASILSSEPSPISTLRPMTPPTLDRLVKKCLSKDPEHRWQTARDLTSELQWIVDAGAPVHTGAARAARLRPSWALVLGVVLVVGVLASLAVWNLTRSVPAAARRPVRLSLPLPASDQLFGLALSPDGETLVYAGGSGANVAGSGAARQLYRRTLDQLEPTPIPGTEGARYPFFSPDGTWIGFEVNGSLKRLPLAGGLPVTIYDNPSASLRATNATGGEDDRIVFSLFGDGTSLQQISRPGGISQAVTNLAAAQGETHHTWPEILPGGRGLLYTAWPSLKMVVQSLETGERRDLVDGSQPRYVASGHIVFVRRSSLWAVPFDLDRLTVTGPEVQVVDTVRSGTDLSSNTFAVARNGTLLYSRGQPSVGQRLVWVTRDGREEALPGEPRGDIVPFRLSPDGKRLAIIRNDEPGSTNFEIWVYDLIANTERQLTFDPAADVFPLWTPDGQRILFSSSRAGGRNLFWRPADGTGRDERLTMSPNLQSPWAWSRDGTRLVFQERAVKTGWDLFVLSVNGDRSTSTLIQTEFNELSPDVSADGRWIAYQSNESGRIEVYVRPFPNVDDGKWRVSREGGNYAIWGPDGRELFYASLDGTRLMAVPVTTEPTFNPGAPKILFEGKYVYQQGAPSYDVSPDGQRFLMIKESGAGDQASARPELIVVLNWLDELKRLVPSNRKGQSLGVSVPRWYVSAEVAALSRPSRTRRARSPGCRTSGTPCHRRAGS